MDIPTHQKRFVLLAALDCYAKAIGRAKKATEDVSASTADLDSKAIIVEHLREEYQDVQTTLGLEGTPMSTGEAQSAEYYRDLDGVTDLQTTALDEWMRQTARAYVPAEVISSWTLEQRRLIAAWLRAVEINVGQAMEEARKEHADHPSSTAAEYAELRRVVVQREHQQARVIAPEFFDLSWFTEPTMLEDLPMSDADVQHWVERGPWGVVPYVPEGGPANPAGDEWEAVKVDDDCVIVDRSKGVYTGLAAAMRAAAERNYAESPDAREATDANDALSSDEVDHMDHAKNHAPNAVESDALHPAEV